MINWFFKHKQPDNLPDYWKAYQAQFNNAKSKDLSNTRFVVFDTETTGFNYSKDRILSIGAVEVVNFEIKVSSALEMYIKQEYFNEETVEIHGLIKNERLVTVTEDEAVELFLDYIKDAVLVAHHAMFDVTMFNQILKRKGLPKLKNLVLDTVNLYKATRIKSNLLDNDASLDKIAENYVLDVTDRHTAAGDAFLTALIFLKTFSLLNHKKKLTLKKILRF